METYKPFYKVVKPFYKVVKPFYKVVKPFYKVEEQFDCLIMGSTGHGGAKFLVFFNALSV
jgi:hypothetical protein